MPGLMPCVCLSACQADAGCYFPPCFQARVDAARVGRKPRIRRRVNACASHLGTVVVALAAWAVEQRLTDGDLTILAIDPPPRASALPSGPRHSLSLTSGFAFSTIHLGSRNGLSAGVRTVA